MAEPELLTESELAELAPDLPGPGPQGLGARHALGHTEEDGFADLCVALLTRVIEDLEDAKLSVRCQAIYDVEQHGVDWALEMLPISDEGRRRVYTLLHDLARCAKLPR